MRVVTWIVGAAFAAAVALPPALGAEIVAEKSKLATVSVTASDGLKAYPGLFEALTAEAKSWAAAMLRQAGRGFRETPLAFRDGNPWTFQRSYDLRSAIGRYVSVVREEETYTGGAHPNHTVGTILWDRDGRKRVGVRPFFSESAAGGPTLSALAKLVQAAIVADKRARNIAGPDDLMWLKGVTPSFTGLGAISLAPSTEPGKSSGLTFHFSPAVVGPYVDGEYTVFVPWKSFEQSLSEAGRTLFGGARPADDRPGRS